MVTMPLKINAYFATKTAKHETSHQQRVLHAMRTMAKFWQTPLAFYAKPFKATTGS